MRFAIIGAGNVATHLASALSAAGHVPVGVYTRGSDSAKVLAEKLDCAACENIDDFSDLKPDLILIATSDAAVAEVAVSVPRGSWVVAHTSGSVPLDALSAHHPRAAVLYPLQTFSKDVPVDVRAVPFFIEATDDESLRQIEALAGTISSSVHHADSHIRARLHVAGVLSSNFIVWLLDMTRRVLADAGLPLNVVEPLVRATIDKTFDVGPFAALTGPARRGDIAVVKKQLESLTRETDRDIYRDISLAILKEFNPTLASLL